MKVQQGAQQGKMIESLIGLKKLAPLVLVLWSSVGLSQEAKPSTLYKTPGMDFYSPTDFYGGNMPPEIMNQIPEHEVLSAGKHIQTQRLMNFLAGEGISMGFGVSPNRDSYFDLYGKVSVDVDLEFPPPVYGLTPESEGGMRYFPDHDATHLWALRGVGPRFNDLANREETIQRWAKVLMDAEGLSTAYNSVYQVKEYWNWRLRQSGANEKQIQAFENANSGVMSSGTWDTRSFLSVLLNNVRGEPLKQFRAYKKHLTWEKYKMAKEAGVPQLVNLEKYLGVKGEEFFVKYAFAPIFAAASFVLPKSGYFDLMKATVKLLEYYYQPFYVRWAEEFQIGEDINQAERGLAERIELFKSGNVFGDVQTPVRGRFEAQRTRQLVTQLGRKLIELQEFGAKLPDLFNEKDIQDIDTMISEAKDLNDQLLADKDTNRSYSAQEIQKIEDRYLKMVVAAESRLPVKHYIPERHRLAFADYSDFWADPFAVVLDRPVVLTKFLSTKGVWDSALKQRLSQLKAEMKGEQAVMIDTTVKPALIAQLEQQAAARYNLLRKGKAIAEGSTFTDNFYLNRLEIFRQNFIGQNRNFKEQAKEYQHITQQEKLNIIATSEYFESTLNRKILQFKAAYQKRFVEMDRDSSTKVWVWEAEADLKWAIERSQVAMIDTLDLLDQGKAFSKIAGKLKIIRGNTDKIAKGETIDPSFYDMIRKVTPMRAGLLHTVCSTITRMCFNQNLTEMIRKIPGKPYARQSEHPTKIEVVHPDGSRSNAINELPKNAVVILGMNHDHAALDAKYVMEIADKLGVDHNLLLTTKEAWPHFQIFKNKDPLLSLKEEPGFKDRVLKFFEKRMTTRVGFSIFPEGELPFWGVQFPLITNFGAFKIARDAAIKFAGKRPVYYVEIQSNFLRYVTAKSDIPIQIDIIAPELVPTEAVTERDSWIEEHREAFERRANDPSRRGQMYDLINREKIPGGRINTTDVPRTYVPARDVMKSVAVAPERYVAPATVSAPAVRCEGIFLNAM